MTDNGVHNESDLVSLVTRMDGRAIKSLYDRYVEYLTAVCARYIADDNDRKDVLQECFIRIFTSLGKFEFRGEGSLKAWMKETYNGLDVSFDLNKDLALVWITGFKPKGDDSRPDRGLSPLCRMILGKDANIMAIVSGPGTKYTWNKLLNKPKELCESNGLFEAIFSCCNYLFVDSKTCDHHIFMPTGATLNKNTNTIKFTYIQKPIVKYFEHDTDCAIHQILSSHHELEILECFCNPPGGDWSGISYFTWVPASSARHPANCLNVKS